MVHCPNACRLQSWVRMKAGEWELHLNLQHGWPKCWAIICYFPDTFSGRFVRKQGSKDSGIFIRRLNSYTQMPTVNISFSYHILIKLKNERQKRVLSNSAVHSLKRRMVSVCWAETRSYNWVCVRRQEPMHFNHTALFYPGLQQGAELKVE